MSPRPTFEHELEVLNQSVTEMGTRVENSYDNLFNALADKDEDTMVTILKCDRIVNDMERGIESHCLSLLTRQQPVAGDLRMVSAALKVVTDIERVGDHVSDIAELLLRLELPDLGEFSQSLPPMVDATKRIIHEAVDAFVAGNSEDAKEVIASDDIIDDLFNKVKEDLIISLKQESKTPDECVDILMITKYLEKIGDHAVNIAEWELFRATGSIKDIRLL